MGSPPPRQAAESNAAIEPRAGRLQLIADGAVFAATVIAAGDERDVFRAGEHRKLMLIDPLAHVREEEAQTGHLRAPMSGTVVAVMVNAGHSVEKGAALMILEAMKMEHTIAAPARGIVTAVNYGVGERVNEGADLLDIDVA